MSPPATEEVSSLLARRKGGKERTHTAARKRRSKRGEDISQSKRGKQLKRVPILKSHKEGKRKRGNQGEENTAFSDQSSASSDEGQSSTSSEEGEDQCRK